MEIWRAAILVMFKSWWRVYLENKVPIVEENILLNRVKSICLLHSMIPIKSWKIDPRLAEMLCRLSWIFVFVFFSIFVFFFGIVYENIIDLPAIIMWLDFGFKLPEPLPLMGRTCSLSRAVYKHVWFNVILCCYLPLFLVQ